MSLSTAAKRAQVSIFVIFSALTARAQVAPIQIDHDVAVSGITSDRFTWKDSAGKPRVAALAHNDGAAGPGGSYGGALREFRYQLPDNSTRIANVTTYGNGGYGGFGYIVSHANTGVVAGCSDPDDSPLGFYFPGHWQRIFEGRHHAIFRFTQDYPRKCSTSMPIELRTMPVTIDWIFMTGRDNPVYAITYNVDQASPDAPVNTFVDDSRAPYGELNMDGDGSTNIDGVAWGDRYKFTTTSAPVSLSSSWTYNVANTVPYVKEWIAGPLTMTDLKDATMGIVLTQTMSQQDAGGARDPNYHDISVLWNTTSATGNGYAADCAYTMPCQDEWAYQANADSVGIGVPNNNSRLTWRTQWGFLGQQTYVANDGTGATPPGYPKKSYSTYIVIGTHSSSPVEAQIAQVENMQQVTLSAATGSVVTSGPAGVTRSDNVTYAPAGYNHVYGALAFQSSANQLDAQIVVGGGKTLTNPLIIVSNYSSATQTVKLGGVTLTADVDYFASTRSATNELWLTLNRTLSGTNHLEVIGAPPGLTPEGDVVGRGDFNGDGKADILLRDATGNIGMWIMNGPNIIGGGLIGNPGGSYTVAAIADFNGDGKADILLRDANNNFGMWIMNGTSIVSGASVGNAGAYSVAGVGDFNGDGKADILLRDANGNFGMWLMNGPVIASGAFVGNPGGSYSVAGVGDFNGDGKADVLLRDATGNIGMWIMNGPVIASGAFVGAPGGTYSVAAVGDFTGDGKADILLRDTTGNLGMWIMNGSTITSGALVGSPGNYSVASARDYSGDGKADILLRDVNGNFGMWIMNGSTIASGAFVGSPGAGYTAY